MPKTPKLPLLKKRTVILDTDQIEAVSVQARRNNREFSAELRTLLTEALIRRAAEVISA